MRRRRNRARSAPTCPCWMPAAATRSNVCARSGFVSWLPARHLPTGHEDGSRFSLRREIGPGALDPAHQSLGDGESVANVSDSAGHSERQGQSSVGNMGLGPAGHRAGRGQSRRQDTPERHLGVAERTGTSQCWHWRPPATVVKASASAAPSIVDKPEGVATKARHVGVRHRQGGVGGDGRIGRRACCAQHVDASL